MNTASDLGIIFESSSQMNKVWERSSYLSLWGDKKKTSGYYPQRRKVF